MIRRLVLMAALVAAAAALVGCSLVPGMGGSASGTLVFDGATEHGIALGETIPGSNIRFVGYSERGAEVLINDQRAVKKVGDSLNWKGTVAPGVEVSMPLRIVLASETKLQTVGTVRITVRNVNPSPGGYPGAAPYNYKVATGYTVQKGDRVPGTTLRFIGKADEGAQFEGTGDYPYRRVGDSVAWRGSLTDRVFLDTTLRVVAYTEDIVTLAGLAAIAVQ